MNKKKSTDHSPQHSLQSIHDCVEERFITRKHILSFESFFSMFMENPQRFTRCAYEYVTDAIDFFGKRKGENGNKSPGFAIFDQEFRDDGSGVWGQAIVEHAIYRILKGFARGGRADKLILLHGPNGSAKSSLVSCLHHGLEEYSRKDEGALYRFNWIFPEERFTREKIGFSKEEAKPIDSSESFALLPEDRVAARLTCPLRDNPLFLIPKSERDAIFKQLEKDRSDFNTDDLSRTVIDGDLSPKNRMIFNALLSAYKGDYAAVLQHVQVERYYISERYKEGAAIIEPQMSVDAALQQITADKSLSSLPPVLQNLSIFEPLGHLVQANHGVVEYADLLKRPVEAYKYLLGTCETGTLNFDTSRIYLDLVMMASSNDKYLESFKKLPEFTSFKGRMELVRVPYLLDFMTEKKIYDKQLSLDAGSISVAPHLTEIVALWVVLTRLRRPDPGYYPEALRPAVERLNPLEKAMLYSMGETPDWLSISQAKDLSNLRGKMAKEYASTAGYEGAFGASPREGKMILRNALQTSRGGCVTPRQAIAEIRRLIGDKSVFEWLQIESMGDYHDQEAILKYVEQYYIRKVDNELKIAMEMIEENQYSNALERYVAQASAWIQKKKVVDPVSGQEREVDLAILAEVEKIIAPEEDPVAFRQDVVSRVGAYHMDHPDESVAYDKIFRQQLARMEKHYFGQQLKRIKKLNNSLMLYRNDRKSELQPEQIADVEELLNQMHKRFGYDPECTFEIVSMLMDTRYRADEGSSI